MRYDVIVDDDAWSDFVASRGRAGILSGLITCIGKNLDRLGKAPFRLSRRPDVPYPRSGRVFFFACIVGDVRYNLAAMFYFEDEAHRAIRVKKIGLYPW